MRSGIARLNPDGSGRSSSFNPGKGVSGGHNSEVSAITLQPDGKVISGGDFTSVDGTNRNHIARLNPDGSLDSTFNPGTGTSGRVISIALQADGKVLLPGDFSAVNGTNRNGIARLNPDGRLDASFDPGTGADRPVYCAAVQTNGQVIIGGDFTSINGTNRDHIARLNSNGSWTWISRLALVQMTVWSPSQYKAIKCSSAAN